MSDPMEIHKLVAETKATLDRVAADAAHGRATNPEDAVVLRGNVESILDAAVAALPLFDLSSIQPATEVVQANQSRVRGDQEPCVVCGKPVRNLEKYQVHMSEQGNLYPTSVDVDVARRLPQGTMYFFPVGPDCAKKVPVAYLHKEE